MSNDESVIKYCKCTHTCVDRVIRVPCPCAPRHVTKRKKLTKTMKWFLSGVSSFRLVVAIIPTKIIIRAIINGTSFVGYVRSLRVRISPDAHTRWTHSEWVCTHMLRALRFWRLNRKKKKANERMPSRAWQKASHMIYCGFYYFPMENIINTCDHLIIRICFYFINFFPLDSLGYTFRIFANARQWFISHRFSFSLPLEKWYVRLAREHLGEAQKRIHGKVSAGIEGSRLLTMMYTVAGGRMKSFRWR